MYVICFTKLVLLLLSSLVARSSLLALVLGPLRCIVIACTSNLPVFTLSVQVQECERLLL